MLFILNLTKQNFKYMAKKSLKQTKDQLEYSVINKAYSRQELHRINLYIHCLLLVSLTSSHPSYLLLVYKIQ